MELLMERMDETKNGIKILILEFKKKTPLSNGRKFDQQEQEDEK